MFRSLFGRKKSRGNDEQLSENSDSAPSEFVIVDPTGGSTMTSLYPNLDGTSRTAAPALPYPLATNTLVTNANSDSQQKSIDKVDMLADVPFTLSPSLTGLSSNGIEVLLLKGKGIVESHIMEQFRYDFQTEKSVLD